MPMTWSGCCAELRMCRTQGEHLHQQVPRQVAQELSLEKVEWCTGALASFQS